MALPGKVALITGAADGIGLALVQDFLANGAKVCMADINENAGHKALENLKEQHGSDKVCFCKCDVTSKDQLEDAFKKCVDTFGQLDIVCNNAGILNEFKWQLMLAINLNAVIEGTYLAVKYMGTQNGGKGGVVINTSSVVGLIPRDLIPVYSASKHGVVGFTRSVAFEPMLLDNGIRVVAICPMAVETSFMPVGIEKGMRYTEQFKKGMTERNFPFVKLSEVTSTIVELINDQSNNGTANVIIPGKGFENIPPPKLE
ncbi:15-hydroxyprostaglandin dehydrogenase [NAD(+)]-like [Ptychodera flava]|uniref:15-hydroxyprostaglandin dehydrogenase [NAD(+)]-like n=1 Tax=Ptychodera flava TaxID=63121 RepID=UPI00396A6C7D